MMASSGFVATGIVVVSSEFGSAQIIDVTPTPYSVPAVDISHQLSPANAREFTPGRLVDNGQFRARLIFDGSQLTRATSGVQYSVTYPNGKAQHFKAFIQEFTPTGVLDDKMTADVASKVTGAVTDSGA